MPDRPSLLTASENSRALASQLPLDFNSADRSSPVRTVAAKVAPTATTPSPYLTRQEAAAYLRCSLRFLDGMGLPFIRKGRCKLYERIDLDTRKRQDKCRGRAWKENLWPVNVDSTAARTRGIGGSSSFSRMDDAYAKALGVSTTPPPRPSSSV
jgi:hypothetical protein